MSSNRGNGKKAKKKVQKSQTDGDNNASRKTQREVSNKKIHTYFSNNEIAEIKNALKTKDLTTTPLLIAATICHKIDLIKKFVQDGRSSINQTGLNNMTALIWAIKFKSIDIVNYLLSNGADPTMKTDSGDNVLVMALEHKLWDEMSFIDLWKTVKKVSFVDVNFTNKNGHNMLHMCVRRDWGRLLKILLCEKPNIDASNANRVTPLMLACFRNNIDVVDSLIDAGSDVTLEDNHGRTTLCYAISTALKTSKPPFTVVDRIINELTKQKSSFGVYLKRRLDLIVAIGKKTEMSVSTCEMLTRIIRFAVDCTNDGLKILLEYKICARISDALKNSHNSDAIKFFLGIVKEVIFYNRNDIVYEEMMDGVYISGLLETLFDLLRDSKNPEIAKFTTNLLILTFRNDEKIISLYQARIDGFSINFSLDSPNFCDDKERIETVNCQSNVNWAKFTRFIQFQLRSKGEEVKRFRDALNAAKKSTNVERNKKSDSSASNSNGSKRSRRRSRAIKAKLTKMKSADFTRRLNLNNGKRMTSNNEKAMMSIMKIHDANNDFHGFSDNINKSEDENHCEIVSSFLHILQDNSEQYFSDLKRKSDENCEGPKWKRDVLNSKFSDFSRGGFSFPIESEKLSIGLENLQKLTDIKKSLSLIIDYLTILIDMIIEKYREKWDEEKLSGMCSCGHLKEHSAWRIMAHIQSIRSQEQESTLQLKTNFDNYTKNLMENCSSTTTKDIIETVERTEKKLLNYEIRGIKLMTYVANLEKVSFKYPKTLTPNEFVKHVENTLNSSTDDSIEIDCKIEVVNNSDDANFLEVYRNETPYELYCNEMSKLPKSNRNKNGDWKRREIEAKLNTIANGFHLINSTMALCNDDDSDIANHRSHTYSVSDLNPKINKTHQNSRKDAIKSNREIERIPNRLKSQISRLRTVHDGVHTLLNGAVRICAREQRVNYVISAGINFNAVELGLDVNDRPLAIKRIRRESWIGRMVKTLVEPLLGFGHSNILPYIACEHDGDELILATPLCKWNLSQYLQVARHASMVPTTIQVVRNLFNGLAALHKCDVSVIVHGNLKPSNIFVDFDGMIKIGEFGMHKALYKVIETPKSSLIWFAKETLEVYMSSSMLECSSISDIQVAGMLASFILTWGKHPFGEEPDVIIENIKGGIVPQIQMNDLDVRDLLLWMMAEDPDARPRIEQVLAHTAFWGPSKKWRFIMSCSGVTQNGFPLPINVDKLHRSIDTFSGGFPQIEWKDIIRCRYPDIRLNENDSSTGLLKFIKNLCDLKPDLASNESDFGRFVITSFSLLPVTLFRVLQNTNWLKHGVFTPFTPIF